MYAYNSQGTAQPSRKASQKQLPSRCPCDCTFDVSSWCVNNSISSLSVPSSVGLPNRRKMLGIFVDHKGIARRIDHRYPVSGVHFDLNVRRPESPWETWHIANVAGIWLISWNQCKTWTCTQCHCLMKRFRGAGESGRRWRAERKYVEEAQVVQERFLWIPSYILNIHF